MKTFTEQFLEFYDEVGELPMPRLVRSHDSYFDGSCNYCHRETVAKIEGPSGTFQVRMCQGCVRKLKEQLKNFRFR